MIKNIVGNEDKIKYLEKIVEEENIAHAYIFTGIEGIGKLEIAKYFSQKILNENNLISCPDFKIIQKQEDVKDLQVDLIRDELINDVYKRPIIANKKVYIINDAQQMNTTAQNVLLKTLEEPPSYVVIILIATSVDSFLPTIKSRLKEVTFNKLTKSQLKQIIKDNGEIENEDLLLDYANGSAGRLNKLLLKENIEKIDILNKFIESIQDKDLVNAFNQSNSIKFKEEDTLEYIQYVFYKKYENNLEYKYIKCIEIIEDTKTRIKSNSNEMISIDNMIIKLIKEI